MIITSSDANAEAEAANLGLLRRRRVDGVIASLVSEVAPATQRALAEFNVPLVLLDQEVHGLERRADLLRSRPWGSTGSRGAPRPRPRKDRSRDRILGRPIVS